MTESLPLSVLIGAFALLTGVVLLVAALAGWRLAIRQLKQRVPAEIAARRDAMAALSAALARGGVDPAQAARLRLSYRTHRAAILALDPHSEVEDAPGEAVPTIALRTAA